MNDRTLDDFQTDDGESIQVRILGEGPPLVILHGWTRSHQEWRPYAERLAERYTVYSWDARGHGGHALHTHPPTLERMAWDLQALIEHYRLQKPILLGHSMGALTVWEYIRQFGCGALAKLCLIDQSPRLLTDADWTLGIYGRFSRQDNERFVARMQEDFAEAVLELAANGHNAWFTQAYRENAELCQLLRQALRALDPAPLIACWASLASADYRAVLPTIAVPTLLIFGEQSNFYGRAVAQYVRDRIPGARLSIYEAADHSPHIWHPQRFIEELKSTL